MANNNGAPPVSESIEEAAQQHLGKESKLDIAEKAVMVEDLRARAAADRKAVADYRMKLKDRLGTSEDKDDHGDIIVADDVNITHGSTSSNGGNGLKSAAMIAGLLAGGGGMGAGVVALLNAIRQPTTAVEQRTETWRGVLRIGYRDGKPFVKQLDESGNEVGK